MQTNSNSWIHTTCRWLQLTSPDAHVDAIGGAVAAAPVGEIESLIEVLVANFDHLTGSPQRFRILMQSLASKLLAESNCDAPSADALGESHYDELPMVNPTTLANLYELLGELDATAAAHALQILAAQGDEESIDLLAGLLRDAPPQDWKHVALGLSPLWKISPERLEFFFQQLEDGYLQPSTMSVLLDLAGFSFRAGKLQQHPWRDRHQALSSLLASVTARLRLLEREPSKFGSDVLEVQRVLNDSVALTVSLCDALGLVGHPGAEESLMQALELSHRRIHTEAAGALARLGFEVGKQRLIELANDPVARLRAVNYADELGFVGEINEELRLPAALAESELVAWLASAERFGVPPSHVELVDARTQYWPSYEEPRDCYLFRYEYQLPGGSMSNIGIAGPITHAFQSDLTVLGTDDIYAAFAGWQAEHEDIYEIPSALLNTAQRREADRLMSYLVAQQLEVVEDLALTFFLGEMALLAIVERGGRKASAITDGLELLHQPLSDSPTTLTPDMLLAIFRGRKLLRTFNL